MSSTALSLASEPDGPDWLAGRVKVLLSHFYDPGRDEPVEEAVIEDWLYTLVDYPRAVVQAACILYLKEPRLSSRGNPVAPSPSDIVAKARLLIAMKTAGNVSRMTDWPMRSRVAPPTPEEIERTRALMREAGFRPKLVPHSGEEG